MLSRAQPEDQTIILATEALLPQAWQGEPGREGTRIYNPTLARVGRRLLMAYRVDTGRWPAFKRRIGICELDAELRVIPGSAQPFSDSMCDGGERHYDPRFVQVGERLFIHYNNNYFTRPNQLYLVEVDPDTAMANGPARRMELSAGRQEIEKNWMLFSPDGVELFAVYSIVPHVVVRLTLAGAGPVVGRVEHRLPWDASAYAARYGTPRGGASPLRWGDQYLAVFHSVRQVSPLARLRPLWPHGWIARMPRLAARIERRLYPFLDQRRYFGGIYAFDAAPPFGPRWISPEPLLHPLREGRPRRWRANPVAERVVYPGGAIRWDDRRILVAYGVHDERCVLRVIDVAGVPKQEIACGE